MFYNPPHIILIPRKSTDASIFPRARTPSSTSQVNCVYFIWCPVCGVSTSSLLWVSHSSHASIFFGLTRVVSETIGRIYFASQQTLGKLSTCTPQVWLTRVFYVSVEKKKKKKWWSNTKNGKTELHSALLSVALFFSQPFPVYIIWQEPD